MTGQLGLVDRGHLGGYLGEEEVEEGKSRSRNQSDSSFILTLNIIETCGMQYCVAFSNIDI